MKYLEPSYFFDFESDPVQSLISEFSGKSLTDKEKTIELFFNILCAVEKKTGFTYGF